MKCYLHIGTEKTGTTLLQNWLYQNSDVLSRRGVALTKCAGFPNNRTLVARFQNVLDDYIIENDLKEEGKRHLFNTKFDSKFEQEISQIKNKYGTCIITSEHFHSRIEKIQEIEELKTFLKRHFNQIKVIVYLREQSSLRISLYSTMVRNYLSGPLSAFQPDIGPADRYYNYLTIMRMWGDVFGREHLLPVIYDRETLIGNDIRTDFVRRCFPGWDIDEFKFDKASENERLTHLKLLVARAVNAAQPRYIRGEINQVREALVSRIAQSVDRISLPENDPISEDIYNRFDDINVAFAREFLGLAQNPFRRPRHEKPEPTRLSTGEIETAIRDIIVAMLSGRGLCFLNNGEIDRIRDLAIRSHANGSLSTSDALLLLKIAGRARPDGEYISSTIESLTLRRNEEI